MKENVDVQDRVYEEIGSTVGAGASVVSRAAEGMWGRLEGTRAGIWRDVATRVRKIFFPSRNRMR